MDLRSGDFVFGTTKNDKYEVVRLINSGGFGTVYEVRSQNGTSLALKTILTALLNDTKLKALQNEAKVATAIVHPNVTRVLYFHDGQTYPNLPPYMLMEYANGGTLQELLNAKKAAGQFFGSEELRATFVQLASGMRAINQKLVHRDVKPDNILLVNGTFKISDFGLSKVIDAATRSQTFKGINHFRYCAPEAWRREKNLPSMDMYSMGITFYEIATLRHPYVVDEQSDFVEAWRNAHFFQHPPDPGQTNQQLGSQLAQVILKMISKRIDDRYSSWDALLERLEKSEIIARPVTDVSRLVNLASSIQQKSEQSRLYEENRARLRQERRDLASFSFQEILTAANETIETFNVHSEFLKLNIRTTALGFSIFSSRGSGALPTISCSVLPTENIAIAPGQTVRAWGLVKAPSEIGFNLLLVSKDENDIYGRWEALYVTDNPIASRRSHAKEPFGLELTELDKRIGHLNAMGIYQYERKPFEAEMLVPLIEELIADS